jgi:DNA-binding transcriptional MerR regulator
MSDISKLLGGRTVAAVARRLGVAPATLRTWDRRYGLGPTDHQPGRHRRYSARDLARLSAMRQLILAGMAPVEAARLAVDVDTDVLTPMVLAPKALEPPVDRLFSFALAFDLAGVKEGISNSLQEHGVAATWELLIAPLLIRMGKFWEESGTGVEVEHFLSEQIKSALLANTILLGDAEVRNGTPILLVSAPEEQHTLPLYALGALLAESRVRATVLGARLPMDSLVELMVRTRPAGVFIWASSANSATLMDLEHLPSFRPAPRIVLGGPGWSEIENSAWVAGDLTSACDALLGSLGL